MSDARQIAERGQALPFKTVVEAVEAAQRGPQQVAEQLYELVQRQNAALKAKERERDEARATANLLSLARDAATEVSIETQAKLEAKERENERLAAELELFKGTSESSDRAFTKLLCNELGIAADESVRKRVDQIVQAIRTYKEQLDEAVRLLEQTVEVFIPLARYAAGAFCTDEERMVEQLEAFLTRVAKGGKA